MKMDLKTSTPWRLMLRSTVLAGTVAVVCVLILLAGGKPLVRLLFGEQFIGAYPVLMVLLAIPLMGFLAFPLGPMLYALDRPAGPLRARLFGATTFFVIVAPLSWSMGVIGAAIAFVIGYATTVSALAAQVWIEYRRTRPSSLTRSEAAQAAEAQDRYLD
jgi:O-antigen/teichoic acid export membrane protein